jgi:hypothetical protein
VCDSSVPQRTIDLESRILRCLCIGIDSTALRERVTRDLAEYTWRVPEHGVVYEAVARIRQQDPASLREQLPPQATRMGFPDVDWAHYLDGPSRSERSLEDMVRDLISNSAACR